jgi:hypothetical protein
MHGGKSASKTNKKAPPTNVEKNIKIKKENEKRTCELITSIYNVLDKSKFDPILQCFQNNEMLREFYMKRIFEVLSERINSEKEEYIEKLIIETEVVRGNLDKLLRDNETIQNKFEQSKINENKISCKLNEIVSLLKEKDEIINNLNFEINHITEEAHRLNDKLNIISNENQNLKSLNEKILESNNLLANKIKILKDEIIERDSKQFEENSYLMKVDEQNKLKEKEIELIRDNFEKMRIKHEEISQNINTMVEENTILSKTIQDKNKLLEEVVSKYEYAKSEHDAKVSQLENDLKLEMEKSAQLQNQIDTIHKVKTRALKMKLKEKLIILEKIEKDFEEYRVEKEKVISKLLQSNQKLINERNNLI